MFDVIETTLSADVAQNGAFTVSYPANRSAGDYVGAHAHEMFALMTLRRAPEDFTVAFTTTITVTYKGATTLPAGAAVKLQLDRLGTDDGAPEKVMPVDGITRAPIHILNLGSPVTADADGILKDASATDSAQAYDSADFVTTFDGTLDVPRNLTATGTADSNHVVTVTGTDAFGQTVKEALTLSGTNVIAGKKAFKTVTSVAVAIGAAGDTFDLGWGDVLGLPAYLPDNSYLVGEMEDGVITRSPDLVMLHVDSPSLADAGQAYVTSPVDGEVVAVYATTNTVLGTADATLTVKTAAGTVGTITIAFSGTAVGVVDSLTSSLANATVAKGATVEIENDAAPSAGQAVYTVVIRPTGAQKGTLTAGVASAATATTGDVRGTYDPDTACDGETSFALLAILPDPANRGVPQYDG